MLIYFTILDFFVSSFLRWMLTLKSHFYIIGVETFVYLVLAGSTNTVSSIKLKKKTHLFH